MGLQQGTLSEAKMLDLMAENPQLIRRPVIINAEKVQLGFSPKQGLRV